jgi:hypothetical protein
MNVRNKLEFFTWQTFSAESNVCELDPNSKYWTNLRKLLVNNIIKLFKTIIYKCS